MTPPQGHSKLLNDALCPFGDISFSQLLGQLEVGKTPLKHKVRAGEEAEALHCQDGNVMVFEVLFNPGHLMIWESLSWDRAVTWHSSVMLASKGFCISILNYVGSSSVYKIANQSCSIWKQWKFCYQFEFGTDTSTDVHGFSFLNQKREHLTLSLCIQWKQMLIIVLNHQYLPYWVKYSPCCCFCWSWNTPEQGLSLGLHSDECNKSPDLSLDLMEPYFAGLHT